MSKSKPIRYYDYVNHPYEKVRDILSSETVEVFRNATQTAAARAHALTSELHVNIGGFEIGTNISVSVNKIEHSPSQFNTPPKTFLHLEWEATKKPQLFPFMKAVLAIYPLTSTETQLDLSGHYKAPFGMLGSAMDSAVGHKIAEASVLRFIKDIAAYLRSELSVN